MANPIASRPHMPGGYLKGAKRGPGEMMPWSRVAERLDRGNVVLLLADGGWKYLSTELWSKDYDDIAEEIEGKVWW